MAWDANTVMGCHFNKAEWSGDYFADSYTRKNFYNDDPAGNSTYAEQKTSGMKFGDCCLQAFSRDSMGGGVVESFSSSSVLTTSSSWSADFWFKCDTINGLIFEIATDTRIGALIQANSCDGSNWSTQVLIKNSSNNKVLSTSGFLIPVNVWNHIYLGRNTVGGASGTHTYYFAINGTLTNLGTFSGTNGTFGCDTYYRVGLNTMSNPNYSSSYGFFDEFRFSNKARWTASFPVPTQEYSATYTGEVTTPTTSSFSYIIGGLD